MVADVESKEIMAIFQGKGSEHDFSIYKRSKMKLSENKALSSIRVCIENTIRRVKRFKILSCRYRNKRKRHGLRMALLCGIHNFEIG